VATTARMDVRVTSTRSASKIVISTVGRYVSTPVNTIEITAAAQPLFTTASPKAFWLAVLAIVQAQVSALP
jgi:hypothetical protein